MTSNRPSLVCHEPMKPQPGASGGSRSNTLTTLANSSSEYGVAAEAPRSAQVRVRRAAHAVVVDAARPVGRIERAGADQPLLHGELQRPALVGERCIRLPARCAARQAGLPSAIDRHRVELRRRHLERARREDAQRDRLAAAEPRHAPPQRQLGIDAAGACLGDVQEAVVDVRDQPAGRAARDEGAVRSAAIAATVDARLHAGADDRVVHADVEVVERQRSARHPCRLQHRAERQGVRALGLDVGIAPAQRDHRIRGRAGERAVDDDAAERARVEAFRQRAGADVPRTSRAQPHPRLELPVEPRLPGGRTATAGVARIAGRSVQIEAPTSRRVTRPAARRPRRRVPTPHSCP